MIHFYIGESQPVTFERQVFVQSEAEWVFSSWEPEGVYGFAFSCHGFKLTTYYAERLSSRKNYRALASGEFPSLDEQKASQLDPKSCFGEGLLHGLPPLRSYSLAQGPAIGRSAQNLQL